MDLAASVAGKVALVTGASGGLGQHFARVLAHAGARVVAAARRVDRLAILAAEAGHNGTILVAERLDVADPASIEACMAAVVDRFGCIDILVNNAGVGDGRAALDVDEAIWDQVLDVNLKGVFLTARAAAAHMKDTGGGSIVNVASILGFRVAPGVVPYAVSKAGVVQMTAALALEWARHKIRVNGIAPGYISTDINRDFLESEQGKALVKRIPQRRLGQPSDLDAAFLLLAGDASPYMTGVVIPVDGGHLVSSL